MCKYCGEYLADAPGHTYSDEWDTDCDACNLLRLFFCEGTQIQFEIYAFSEEPYTLAEAPAGVTLHLEGCEWENEYCWHTYFISGVGVGAYDLRITHATDNASSSFTLQVIPHHYENGRCNICGQREEQAHTHTWLATISSEAGLPNILAPKTVPLSATNTLHTPFTPSFSATKRPEYAIGNLMA